MFAIVQDVRDLGRLPPAAKLPDAEIDPHLEAAGRELKRRIGEYETGADAEKIEACTEAECCLCMAYLLPVLNTFFTQGIAGLQKEIGETDFQFHSVDDLKKLADLWTERAMNRVKAYITESGTGDLWYGEV
jgi:hypothetical protein